MERRRSTTLFALFLLASLPAPGAELLHYERLGALSVSAAGETIAAAGPIDGRARVEAARATGPVTLDFDAFGRRFTLDLEPNAPLNAAAGPDLRAAATAYKGSVRGHPESWARVVVADGAPSGIVWDGARLYGIEAPGDTLTGADGPAMFRLDDVYLPPGTLTCGAAEVAMSGADMLETLVAELEPLAAVATRNLDLGAVADVEFGQLQADARAAVLTRLNNVDGIFAEQVGVQITVQQVDVFADEPDPFTSTDSGTLLEELSVYRADTPTQDALGLTHLFTGRNLDGTTVGVAYFGGLCERRNGLGRSFGAGLTESRLLGPVVASLVAAHEIGHNFGAPHDGDPDGACASTSPDTFLMAPSVNGNDRFSACSIEQMEIEIAGARCLTSIDFVDAALASAPPATGPFVGVEFDYVVTATNTGAAEATSVGVDLTFDSALEIIALTPASGSCETLLNMASCDLGALPGSSARAITARLRTASAGQRDISGTVTASSDIDSSNDSFNDSIQVVVAADLAVSAGSLRLERNQSGALSVTLSNLAGEAAQSVRLSAAASATVRIDSATVDGAACTVEANSTACELASLGGLASASIVIMVTGLSGGTGTVSLSATAATIDSNAANNASTASVEVVDPAAQGSSGGGSIDAWLLLGLLGALARRRTCRRTRRP